MRTALVFAASLALVLISQCPASARQAPPRPGPAAETVGASPLQALAERAAAGDAQAQHQLAQAYRDGKGVRKAPATALQWFELAATNGIREAALEASQAHEAGIGTRRDPAAAARWLYRAGELGDANARARFVELYLGGRIASIGGSAGAQWLQDRADAGELKAQLALAAIHEDDRAVPPDSIKAEHWYRLAAYQADPEARFRLGRLLLGEPEWAGAEEGERWLTAAAHRGHAEAQYVLGMAHAGGLDLPPSLRRGIPLLRQAAAQNHPDALMALAGLLAKGHGFLSADPLRAFVYYDLAASQGRPAAAAARDRLVKDLPPRQQARARQLSQDVRELQGL